MFNINHINLLYYLLKKEIKSMYVGSTIGMFWVILRPLLIIAVFWLVFSEIMRVRPYANRINIPYIVFMLSTIFFWFGFQDGILRSTTSIMEKSEIVKRVYMPIEILPIVSVLSSYFHHISGALIFFSVMSILYSPSPLWVLVIPLIGLQILFSLGLGFLLSAISVYMRDIPQIMGIFLQGIFFLTPIIYPLEIVPEKMKVLFYLNPLTYFIKTYQDIIIYRSLPAYSNIIIIFLVSVISLLGGLKVFRRLKDGFADTL